MCELIALKLGIGKSFLPIVQSPDAVKQLHNLNAYIETSLHKKSQKVNDREKMCPAHTTNKNYY